MLICFAAPIASGTLLRGDSTVQSASRADLKEISCVDASGPSDGKEEWTIFVDRRTDINLPTKAVWGLGSSVMLVHSATSEVLASTGQVRAPRGRLWVPGAGYAQWRPRAQRFARHTRPAKHGPGCMLHVFHACTRPWNKPSPRAWQTWVAEKVASLAEARPSLIPSLCTHYTRAGIEWRR